MSNYGTIDKAEFSHKIKCPINLAWKYLFTQKLDKYYLSKHNIGTCDEESIILSEDKKYHIRTARITPNLGEDKSWTMWAFIGLIKKVYGVDKIQYLTTQTKYFDEDNNGIYTILFQNSEYQPNVESFNTNGIIRLIPIDDNNCTMETIIHVKTYISVWGGHSVFMSAMKNTTDNAFLKMIESLEEFVNNDNSAENNHENDNN
jgi:hypothetical protein